MSHVSIQKFSNTPQIVRNFLSANVSGWDLNCSKTNCPSYKILQYQLPLLSRGVGVVWIFFSQNFIINTFRISQWIAKQQNCGLRKCAFLCKRG